MNAPILASHWPKARFTVAQIWALIEKGLLPEDAKFELLNGEVIPMSPKGPLHEDVRLAVMRWLKALPNRIDALAETTLYLDKRSFMEPDYVLFSSAIDIKDLTPDKVLLAIEVADESWKYDVGKKAARYARHGVQEYWVIQAATRMTRVHRGAGTKGWKDIRDVPAGSALAPLCAPKTPLKL